MIITQQKTSMLGKRRKIIENISASDELRVKYSVTAEAQLWGLE